MRNKLFELFASEEVIGITYEDINNDGDERAMLPGDFGEMGNCTNCAKYVISKMGKGKVFGFLKEDNPSSTHRAIENAGGHDFVVLDQRYIIDIWISYFTCEEPAFIYDLESGNDYLKIVEIFGDPTQWSIQKGGRFEKMDMMNRLQIRRAFRKGKERHHYLKLSEFCNHKPEGLELTKDGVIGKRWAFFLKDATIPGSVRYQEFDDLGFYTHHTFDSYDEALKDAIHHNFLVPDPGALNRLSITPDWANGMKMVEACQNSWSTKRGY
jgi:hypothetical protein